MDKNACLMLSPDLFIILVIDEAQEINSVLTEFINFDRFLEKQKNNFNLPTVYRGIIMFSTNNGYIQVNVFDNSNQVNVFDNSNSEFEIELINNELINNELIDDKVILETLLCNFIEDINIEDSDSNLNSNNTLITTLQEQVNTHGDEKAYTAKFDNDFNEFIYREMPNTHHDREIPNTHHDREILINAFKSLQFKIKTVNAHRK